MNIGVYYVASTNVYKDRVVKQDQAFLKDLSKRTNINLELCDLKDVKKYPLVFSFIAGGGVEGRFLKVLNKLPQPIFLLTTGENNSLAAAMEILSYLRKHNIKGEIIHGSKEYLTNRINDLVRIFNAIDKLQHLKIGMVGKPSDWLIASNVDAKQAKQLHNIEIIDIKMEELIKQINKHQYEENEYTKLFNKGKYDAKQKELALDIYGALKRICKKYQLDGISVRCFDLLSSVKGTSCIALALLNAEGIYAACEGDIPSLISMALLGELTKEKSFQANPSSIDVDKNEIVFAHCTLPINMVNSFKLMSHFESGIGVALKGNIDKGPITVFKASGLLDEYFVSGGQLLTNLNKGNLCRTQVKLKLNEDVNYFLKESIGNHHLIIKGDYSKLIQEFFEYYQ